MVFQFLKKRKRNARRSETEAAERVMRASCQFFDDVIDIMRACRVNEEGVIGEPELFAQKMYARAKKLATKKPTSAVMAWLEAGQAGMASNRLTPSDVLSGYLNARREETGFSQDDFDQWVRAKVLEDHEFADSGLKVDAVDWQVIGRQVLGMLLSKMQNA